jgi:hypothetical protein
MHARHTQGRADVCASASKTLVNGDSNKVVNTASTKMMKKLCSEDEIARKVTTQSQQVPQMCQLRTTTCDPRNKNGREIPATDLTAVIARSASDQAFQFLPLRPWIASLCSQ